MANFGVLPGIVVSGIGLIALIGELIGQLPLKNIYDCELIIIIIFNLNFLMIFIILVGGYSNIVIEVQIDEEYVYIRKYRKFVKISWDDIKYIKSFRTLLLGSGTTILWIKTKKSGGRNLCLFGGFSHEDQFKTLSNLFFEIKKRIVLKHYGSWRKWEKLGDKRKWRRD